MSFNKRYVRLSSQISERNLQEIRRAKIAIIPQAENEEKEQTSGKESPDVEYAYSKRQQQMQEIKTLYSSDVAIRAIAHSLGMNPITARKYIHLDAPPVKEELGRKILLSADYLQSRIKENPNIGVIHLWREIKKKRTLRSMINRL